MQRARSCTARTAAALATLAIAPAAASAAPGTVTDDSAAAFAAGTNTGTEVVAPGSLQLARNGVREDFGGGPGLPDGWSGFTWIPPGGTIQVGGGGLTVDGAAARVDATSTIPQVLEFRAVFGGDDFQHVGFAAGSGPTADFNGTPWAMFSTGSDGQPGTLFARTAASDTNQENPVIGGVDATLPHVYRIERTATEIRFFVDGLLVRTAIGAVVPTTADLRPVASDFTTGGSAVTVDWGQLFTYGTTGTFQSRVLDSARANTDWTTLAASAAGNVTFQTRSGNTATPGASWSGWTAVSAGGAIPSPSSRYIQYRATLPGSPDGTTTPSVEDVTIAYNTDDPPTVAIAGVTVTGTTARVTFSSTATDVARYECSLDGGAFATCAGRPVFTGLTPGAHTIAVRAIDRAGNVGATLTQGFTAAKPPSGGGGNPPPIVVDTTPPNVRVTVRFLRATRRGVVKLRLACSATEERCRVTARIKRGDRVVAQRTLTIKGGKKRTFVLKLSESTLRALVHKGRLKTTARVTARDAAGNTQATSKRVTLLEPEPR